MARRKPTTSKPPSRRSERIEKRVTVEEEQKQPAVTPSKPKRFRRPRQRKRCRLLALPGELRNQIYAHVVLQSDPSDPIVVTTKGPGQPALLQTCRQIRNEAGTLYYTSNEFSFKIESYNGAEFVPFARQARKFRCFNFTQNVRFRIDQHRSWDNLVAWIKASYMEGALEPEWYEPMGKDDLIASNAFKLVDQCGLWGWERKEQVLKTLYDALRGTASNWVKPGDRVYY